jgi:hypothetical protein
MAQGSTKETAKELVAALSLNDDLRAQFDAAGSADEKLEVLSKAGYKVIVPDDLAEVQSDIEQKGMFSDIGGYLGKAVVNAGFDPLKVGAGNAATIGKTVGQLADLFI